MLGPDPWIQPCNIGNFREEFGLQFPCPPLNRTEPTDPQMAVISTIAEVKLVAAEVTVSFKWEKLQNVQFVTFAFLCHTPAVFSLDENKEIWASKEGRERRLCPTQKQITLNQVN